MQLATSAALDHPTSPGPASFNETYPHIKAHLIVGPLSPGAARIVKYCDTNFSANIICITVEIFTIPLWLWDCWKVVPN